MASIRRFFSTGLRRLYNAEKVSPSLFKVLKENHVDVKDEDFATDLDQPVLTHLHNRGLVSQIVNEEQLAKEAAERRLGLYCGADPTATSLHLGNLLPLLILLHFNLRGHNVFPIIGGATGAVGDPSGRTTERTQMKDNTRLDHVSRISQQLVKFFAGGVKYAATRNPLIEESQVGTQQLKNNYEWWKDIGMLEFLAIYGRHIRVNQMLARDSIKSRLESEQGIGYNEFSYQLLQAYDFYYLNKTYDVDIQVGGNDQYGNIVAGIDLIGRLGSKHQPFGITVPLLTTASGVKFGKSAGNAVFIDKALTSSYELYQKMYRTEDADVKRFLYKFSMLPLSVIDRVAEVHDSDPTKRFGQRVLAMEMCDLIHGDGVGYDNYLISETLYGSQPDEELDADGIIAAFTKQNLVTRLSKEELASMPTPTLLYTLCNGKQTKSNLRRMMTGGAVSLGRNKKNKLTDPKVPLDLSKAGLIGGKLLIVRLGKDYYVALIEE